MKKEFFLITCLLIISIVIHAQPKIGARAAINISNQQITSNADLAPLSTKVGFVLGMYFTGTINEKISIQPELMFSGMGSEIEKSSQTNVFNYLSIPVFFKYNITRKINLHAGPQLGILLTAKLADGSNSVDIKESYKGTDWGACFGVGTELGKFDAGVRYYMGLSNIQSNTEVIESCKNFGFQIFIGYRLSELFED